MSEHTPIPWRFEDISSIRQNDGLGYIYGPYSDSHPIAHTGATEFSPDVNRADAEFIVTAVNSHDGLLEALECLLRTYVSEGDSSTSAMVARAAIKAAKP